MTYSTKHIKNYKNQPSLSLIIKRALVITLSAGFILGCSAKKEETPISNSWFNETLNYSAKELNQMLFRAIDEQNHLLVEELLKKGADANSINENQKTPLILGVLKRNTNIVKLLILRGAKIYQPITEGRDRGRVASNFIFDNDEKIKGLFENQKRKINSKLQKLISSKKFDSALGFIKDQYIPVDEKISTATFNSVLQLVLFYADKSALNLVDYLLDEIDRTLMAGDRVDDTNYDLPPPSYASLSNELFNFSAKTQSASFFRKVLGLFYDKNGVLKSVPWKWKKKHLLVKQTQTPFGFFGPQFLSPFDNKNIHWLSEKINILTEFGFQIDPQHIKPHNQTGGKSAYLDLLKSVFNNPTQKKDKELFLNTQLLRLWRMAQAQTDFLYWGLEGLELWRQITSESSNITSEEMTSEKNTFDQHIFNLLRAIEDSSFDTGKVQKIFSYLYEFTPVVEPQIYKSLFTILDGKFKTSYKEFLLATLMKVIKTLPPDTLSLAIKSKSHANIESLVNSGIDLSQQQGVINSILENTQTGDRALKLLTLVKENHVPLDNREGIEAFTKLLKNLSTTPDRNWLVVDFLINTSHSPLISMSHTQFVSLIKDQIQKTKTTRTFSEWIKKILKRRNQVFYLAQSPLYEVNNFELHIREGDNVKSRRYYTLKTSLVWDYIVSMLNVYSESPNQLLDMSETLLDMINTFPDQNMAMSFSNEPSLSSTPLLTQSILPLSLLLSLDKKSLEKTLKKTKFSKNRTPVTYLDPPLISLNRFLEGPVYDRFSQYPHFWSAVTTVLTKSQMKLPPSDNIGFVHFIKILSSLNLFSKYPGLANKFQTIQMKLNPEVKKCVINAQKFYAATNTLASEEGPWVQIGEWSALDSLKNRTCKGKRLKDEEVNFVQYYIRENFKLNPIEETEESFFREVSCSSKNIAQAPYSFLGVLSQLETPPFDAPQLDAPQVNDPLDEPWTHDMPRNQRFTKLNKELNDLSSPLNNSDPRAALARRLEHLRDGSDLTDCDIEKFVASSLEFSSATAASTAASTAVSATKAKNPCPTPVAIRDRKEKQKNENLKKLKGRCYVYDYDRYAEQQAQIQFLKQWFTCSQETKDGPLNKVFKKLSKKHKIVFSDIKETAIKTCHW